MIKNLDWLRSLSAGELPPDFGARLYEIVKQLDQQHQTIAQQVNGNSTGQPAPPPSISGLTVTGQNGHFNVAIQDNGEIYRGIRYYVEHASKPDFSDAVTEPMGDSRNHNLTLGNTTRYFRAYSAYPWGPASKPVYFGGLAQPRAVSGGGSLGPPNFTAPQSSGTGTPGQSAQGPGQTPFRSKNGKPPVRVA